MTDESILYIFKFSKVCIFIVAFLVTSLLLCFGRLIIQLVASIFERTQNIVHSHLMYCSSTPFSFVEGYFVLKPLTNQGVKLFCVQAN